MSTGPLLRRRPGHLLQPLHGRGRGGRGSRPLIRFATRQGDGRFSRSSRPSHRSPPAVSLHRHNVELEHRFQRGALNAGRPHYGVLFASTGERSLLTISANDRLISEPFVQDLGEFALRRGRPAKSIEIRVSSRRNYRPTVSFPSAMRLREGNGPPSRGSVCDTFFLSPPFTICAASRALSDDQRTRLEAEPR